MGDVLTTPLVWLFAGVFAILGASSLLGRRLAARDPGTDAKKTATIANLRERITAWWVIVGVLAGAFLMGEAAVLVLFALVSFWCLREFLSLTPTPKADHYALAAAFYLVLPAQYLLLWNERFVIFAIAIPVYGFLGLPVLSALMGETRDFLQRVSKVQWAVMLAVYCTSHVPALLILDFPDQPLTGFGLLAFLLLVVQGSDVLQYTFGKLFGKHPVAPSVSPNKTWEGLLLGGAAATALGAALWWITPFPPLGAAAMALVLVIAGFFGGLVLSAVKRSLGAKDWGTMVEGHGGMLDRMDSLAFSAPLFFHLTNFFFTG